MAWLENDVSAIYKVKFEEKFLLYDSVAASTSTDSSRFSHAYFGMDIRVEGAAFRCEQENLPFLASSSLRTLRPLQIKQK